MALLPYLDPKDASPEVQKLLTGRPVLLNVQRMTANAQKIFVQRSRLSNALFTQTTIIGHWRQTASILETTEVELEEFAGKIDILANMPPRA